MSYSFITVTFECLLVFHHLRISNVNCVYVHVSCIRYREAEVDCTEALNLDDRYIKAYSRRATARKELGMIKEAKEGIMRTHMFILLSLRYIQFLYYMVE